MLSTIPSEVLMAAGDAPGSTLIIRKVPEDLRDWIAETKPAGASKNEFLIASLRSAMRTDAGPFLFDSSGAVLPRPAHAPGMFKFIDLFAGIGGFRIGMTLNGGECVFTSEWDRFAQKTYAAWYGESRIHGDINDPSLDLERDIPDHDVLCGGFPCQPFSIAGVSKKNSLGRAHGFADEKQGNLFFRICDIIDAKRPPVLFLENVKNLKSHDRGRTWGVIRSELERRDYVVHAQVIDAKAWVPQHRERIFIVCFDKGVFGDAPPFSFPTPPNAPPRLGDILEPKPDPRYTLTDHLWNYLQRYAEKHRAKGNGFGFGLVNAGSVTRTISARYHKDGSEILIEQKGRNPRRLTPSEAARLMGYGPDYAKRFGHEHGFPIVVSDTQAYRQFGNSVVPRVVEAIGAEIVKTMTQRVASMGNGCMLKGRARRKATA
ncbi:MAG: DNA (cytosine-5-)-methyltransferase [Phycisphaerales bacterium]